MSNDVQIKGGSINFFGLLTVLFIGLKLTGYITWSWFWVFSPLIFSLGLALLLLLIALILLLFAAVTKW